MTDVHPEYAGIIDRIVALSPDRYYEPVFRHPMDFYRTRVEMIGAGGFGRVFDAGHGFGQWSVALAETGSEVVGWDHNGPRTEIARLVASTFHAGTVEFEVKALSAMDGELEPESFDLVWCWGVVMFTDRCVVMPAFNRILKPGGTLILGSVNTPLRWAYKLVKGIRDKVATRSFIRFCRQGMFGVGREKGVNAFSLSGARRICAEYGFELSRVDYDGRIDVAGERVLEFEQTPLRILQNIELVARKARSL